MVYSHQLSPILVLFNPSEPSTLSCGSLGEVIWTPMEPWTISENIFKCCNLAGDATGIQCLEARDTAKHPTIHRIVSPPPEKKMIQPQISIVPRMWMKFCFKPFFFLLGGAELYDLALEHRERNWLNNMRIKNWSFVNKLLLLCNNSWYLLRTLHLPSLCWSFTIFILSCMVISLFHRWRNWGTRRLSIFLKITVY